MFFLSKVFYQCSLLNIEYTLPYIFSYIHFQISWRSFYKYPYWTVGFLLQLANIGLCIYFPTYVRLNIILPQTITGTFTFAL